jgi:hypothetical protein
MGTGKQNKNAAYNQSLQRMRKKPRTADLTVEPVEKGCNSYT